MVPAPGPVTPPPAQRQVSTLRPAPANSKPLPLHNRFAPLTGMPDTAVEDEDAEGSEEDPAPKLVKGKQKQVVAVPAPVKVVAPEGIKVRHENRWVPVEDSDEYCDTSAEKETEKDQHPASQVEKKRVAPETTGKARKRRCKRCRKRDQACYEQKGYGSACFLCATLKMRCESPSDDDRGNQPAAPPPAVIPAKRPLPEASSSKKPASALAPAPSQPAPKKQKVIKPPARELDPAPALAPSQPKKKKLVKTPAKVDLSDDEEDERRLPKGKKIVDSRDLDPAPAPAPSRPKKFVKAPGKVDTPAKVDSSDDEGDERRLPKGKKFADFEKFFGIFFFWG
jgi:hypothetical protein